jgi:hypothetical protein
VAEIQPYSTTLSEVFVGVNVTKILVGVRPNKNVITVMTLDVKDIYGLVKMSTTNILLQTTLP